MVGVPSNIEVPFVGIEFDASRALRGPVAMPFNVFIIGQKIAAGTGVSGTPYRVFGESEVAALAGPKSMLYVMAHRFFQNNNISNVYVVPLSDATGTQATRVLTITGTATESRELPILINGYRLAVPVSVDDSPTIIGDAVAAAINGNDYINWDAVNVTGVVTCTCTNDGVAAGDNDMRVAALPGEAIPAGVSASFGATVAGTVDPDVQDALDGIGSNWASLIVSPYSDDTNMGAIEDHMLAASGPIMQRDGLCIQCLRGTVGELIAAATAAGRNSQHMALGDCGSRMISTYELSAAVAGQVAASVQDDPAVPLMRLTLAGVRPNLINERRTLLEANSLSQNGVMTFTDDLGVQTQSMVTMYLRNSAGAVDASYHMQNKVFILQRLRYRFVQGFLSKYPRAKLLRSADRIKAGQKFVTPDLGRAYAIDWFDQNEKDGQVQGLEQFKEDVICQISGENENRLDWILPTEMVKQMIVGSGVLQFY